MDGALGSLIGTYSHSGNIEPVLTNSDGEQFATSKSTLSADGKTLTVVTDVTSAVRGQAIGKPTEVWVKK